MVIKRFISCLFVLTLLTVTGGAGNSLAETIYFTESFEGSSGSILEAYLDDSRLEELITTSGNPTGVALDPGAGKIYWIETESSRILRANLDGSEQEELLTASGRPTGIALDPAAGKLYWTEVHFDGYFSFGYVLRASLDGSEPEQIISTSGNANGITLDPAAGKLYWTHSSDDLFTPDNIQVTNLDGSGMEAIVTTLGEPHGIALDLETGKLYWTEQFDDALDIIQRSNLDGSEVEELMTTSANPYGIALDTAGGKVYWTECFDDSSGVVQRANLDGSDVEALITTSGTPYAVIFSQETIVSQETGQEDEDEDGISDDEDNCPSSDLSETIVINGRDTGVLNQLFDDGCTISDRIADCAMAAGNHGSFVRCVAKLTNSLKKENLLTGKEKGAIQRCAAKAKSH